jgi:metal-responsive CopG/Arc/MetJ family transcriptional regulator
MRIAITISRELLAAIDRMHPDRSTFVERACRSYLARLKKARREAADIAIINAHANRLNKEARDVIGYQKSL